MGLSATLASTIIMARLIVFTGAFIVSTLETTRCLISIYAHSLSLLSEEPLSLKMRISEVNDSSVAFYVVNEGSKTIFLRETGYRWNSVIIAYNGSGWRSYLIRDYRVVAVRVSGSNISFSPEKHKYIAPGEEAYIIANLPAGAPPIPHNSKVTVVFASHYGACAMREAVRT